MLHRKKIEITLGVGATALYARMASQSEEWRRVGEVCLIANALHVSFGAESAICRPAWEAALSFTEPARGTHAVRFAVLDAGRFLVIAEADLDPRTLNRSRAIGRAMAPTAPRALGVGPRPVRSSWPEPSRIVAGRRR